MLPGMRGMIRLSMVWLLAVLFAASGVAAHACFAAHHVAGLASTAQAQAADHAHHVHAGIDDGQVGHHHSAAHHQQVGDHAPAADHALPGADACGKCCGSCTLATGVMPTLVEQPLFVVAPALFAGPSDPGSDSLIRVDPGIPKRIV
jgi:hypothetical protein